MRDYHFDRIPDIPALKASRCLQTVPLFIIKQPFFNCFDLCGLDIVPLLGKPQNTGKRTYTVQDASSETCIMQNYLLWTQLLSPLWQKEMSPVIYHACGIPRLCHALWILPSGSSPHIGFRCTSALGPRMLRKGSWESPYLSIVVRSGITMRRI